MLTLPNSAFAFLMVNPDIESALKEKFKASNVVISSSACDKFDISDKSSVDNVFDLINSTSSTKIVSRQGGN